MKKKENFKITINGKEYNIRTDRKTLNNTIEIFINNELVLSEIRKPVNSRIFYVFKIESTDVIIAYFFDDVYPISNDIFINDISVTYDENINNDKEKARGILKDGFPNLLKKEMKRNMNYFLIFVIVLNMGNMFFNYIRKFPVFNFWYLLISLVFGFIVIFGLNCYEWYQYRNILKKWDNQFVK